MRKFSIILIPLFLSIYTAIPISYAACKEDGSASERYLPIVMYHNILNNRRSAYIVSSKQFEQDLIAFKKAGYTTVFPSEIIRYVKKQGTLPEKPLLITFDDGHYNIMFYGLPLLIKYNQKALINIIGSFSEYSSASGGCSNPGYSHLTWEQIKYLNQSGHFEIGNHTYGMHRFKPRFGIGKKVNETNLQYKTLILKDIMRLQNKLQKECKIKAAVFAYPFGEFNETAKEALISAGFEMLLTCAEKVNRISQNAESLYSLKRFNRNPGYSSKQLINMLSKR